MLSQQCSHPVEFIWEASSGGGDVCPPLCLVPLACSAASWTSRRWSWRDGPCFLVPGARRLLSFLGCVLFALFCSVDLVPSPPRLTRSSCVVLDCFLVCVTFEGYDSRSWMLCFLFAQSNMSASKSATKIVKKILMRHFWKSLVIIILCFKTIFFMICRIWKYVCQILVSVFSLLLLPPWISLHTIEHFFQSSWRLNIFLTNFPPAGYTFLFHFLEYTFKKFFLKWTSMLLFLDE